jgi:CDP-paratose 2-epimerase
MQIHGMPKFNGGVFNVGGGNFSSVSLAELTTICQTITGNKIHIHPVAETRKADIRVYLTDNEKIHSLCGWKPEIEVEKTMKDIFEWIHSNEILLSKILQE